MPVMDIAMYWITDRLFWIPFYILVIFFLIRHFRWQGFWMILTIIVAIIVADQTASSLFKPYFARNRPCHELSIQPLVHLVRGCGGQYGFVSSHSANTFAFAMLMWLMLKEVFAYTYYFFIWAILVSYSRIYVGVHYPLDLFVGAWVGIISALLCFSLYKWVRRFTTTT